MKQRQRGFTLIEQIVVFSLMGIVLPVLGGFFFSTFLRPVENSAAVATSQDIRTASEWISHDLAAGPMGNNLAVSGGPSLASVVIGSSPGFSGNNSLTITYHTWPSPGSTAPDTHYIVYDLEQLDPSSSDIQLVRREDDGTATTVAQHIASASDVVFSGSAQSGAGAASSGITLSITSTLDGSIGTATRQASFVYSVPRSYQPTPTPTPSAQSWNLSAPYFLVGGSGYWQVITTLGAGAINVNWTTGSAASIQIWVFQGAAFGAGQMGDSALLPTRVTAPAVASNSGTTSNLSLTTGTQPAGQYTIYLYNADPAYVTTTAATSTYVSQ